MYSENLSKFSLFRPAAQISKVATLLGQHYLTTAPMVHLAYVDI